MSVKPLHVRVAEAVGCKPTFGPDRIGVGPDAWRCPCEFDDHAWDSQAEGVGVVKRYDTDWSATGPLLDKYDLGVQSVRGQEHPFVAHTSALDEEWDFAGGDTRLIAVCNLILQLKAKGKLRERE
jgi:hypothetical protein